MMWLVVLGLALGLTGCAPAVGAGIGLFAIVLVGAAALVRSAGAGEVAPCSGSEETVCNPQGYLYKQCCPKGAKCNFQGGPYVDCGVGRCVAGRDPGRCPAPEPSVSAAGSESACAGRGSWQRACIDHKVSSACIAPAHTNYSGPPLNPPYRTCGGDRCTTHLLIEDCLPAKPARCSGDWKKVCFGGKVTERCAPKGLPESLRATRFVTCPDGSCAVGADRSACP